jgi:hypothetical protein
LNFFKNDFCGGHNIYKKIGNEKNKQKSIEWLKNLMKNEKIFDEIFGIIECPI